MDESFTPPIIFGYLGFDCAIATNGELGAPIPTYAVLAQLPVQGTLRHFASDPSAKILRDWVNHPKPTDIPDGKTANDVTKEREGQIATWIKARNANYNFADLLYRSDLKSARQQFIIDNKITQ
jgi:hypothetical protein